MTDIDEIDRFRDDIQSMTGFEPERHESEVAVSIIAPHNESWTVDLNTLFEAANQHGLRPFAGELNSEGVNMVRFELAEATE